MRNKITQMKKLIEEIEKAAYAYYQEDKEIMSDKSYDIRVAQLEELEMETGIVLGESPIHKVQGYLLDGLEKVKHSRPMLSADKTKDIGKVKEFIGDREVMGSYKLDGLTIVLRLKNGKLIQAITRGNGEVGEDVTESVRMIKNIPKNIPYMEELEIRGEGVISWKDFNDINEGLEEPYSHPRNLAAGSIRSLDTKIARNRNVRFVAFEVVNGYNGNDRLESLEFLDSLGFETVQRGRVIEELVDRFVEGFTAEKAKYPVDGLIFNYRDLDYSKSLGSTSHHPLDMIALKWKDETYETEMIDVEWATTRTGRINPTAVFKTVEIDGADVGRATTHNVSIFNELKLGKGDTITVYKSNMIIPAIDENLTQSGTFTVPDTCPCCGEPTEIKMENKSKTLWCTNSNCPAKILSQLVHFVQRDAMNIDGLSEKTLEKLLELGYITNFKSLFKLDRYKKEMTSLEGFGAKSVAKLLNSIKAAQTTTLDKFIFALGIPQVGKSTAKDIAKYCEMNIDKFIEVLSRPLQLQSVDGIGSKVTDAIAKWFMTVGMDLIAELIEYIEVKVPEEANAEAGDGLEGKVFVVTGSVYIYKNRKEVQAEIEKRGGKVTGSVSKKTDYLINNDIESASSKNVKAKSLGVPIITEEEFIEMISK